jgi:hypothetical protein
VKIAGVSPLDVLAMPAAEGSKVALRIALLMSVVRLENDIDRVLCEKWIA